MINRVIDWSINYLNMADHNHIERLENRVDRPGSASSNERYFVAIECFITFAYKVVKLMMKTGVWLDRHRGPRTRSRTHMKLY